MFKIEKITLPIDPDSFSVGVEKDLIELGAGLVEFEAPYIFDMGPGVKVLSISGILGKEGKLLSDIETDYLIPLERLSKKFMKFAFLIADDDQAAFWTPDAHVSAFFVGVPTLSDETTIVAKGKNSLKVNVPTGAFFWARIKHVYSPAKDWSKQDFVTTHLYGLNDDSWIQMILYAPNVSNRFEYQWTDNWSGWSRKFLRKDQFTVVGNPSWKNIAEVHLQWNSWGVRYVDRTCVGVGVLVEADDTRYDGIFNIKTFDWQELAGYIAHVKYKMDLYDVDDYY